MLPRRSSGLLDYRFVRFWRHLTLPTLKEVLRRTGAQRLPGLAAEIAFNAMLALFPGILALLTAIGLVGFSQQTFKQLALQLSQIAPTEALTIIERFAGEISRSQNQGLFSLSFVLALWAASGALSATMNALDQIHQVSPKQMRPLWKAKLISLGLTIGTILLLVLASILVFVSDLIVQIVAQRSGFIQSGLLAAWRLLSWPLALGIVVMASAFVYRYGPSRWTKGTPILPGAILAAVFWAVLSGLFRLYVSHFGNYNRAYGAIGAVIVLLVWLHLTSLMLLIGAQMNVTVGERLRQERDLLQQLTRSL